METFEIIVQELLSRTISVQAQNIEEAIEKVNQMYRKTEIVLDVEDFLKKEIIPVTLKNEKEREKMHRNTDDGRAEDKAGKGIQDIGGPLESNQT